jgi:hypothetical protein
MKKITAVDERLQSITDDVLKEGEKPMPTRREVLRMIANTKAETADDSRRTIRIVNKLRNKTIPDLVLENDDMNFLQKLFESNPMNLTSWCQGQVLELIESADKVEKPA